MNPTEIVASLINSKNSIAEGIQLCTGNDRGIHDHAASDARRPVSQPETVWDRTPLIIGRKEDARTVFPLKVMRILILAMSD